MKKEGKQLFPELQLLEKKPFNMYNDKRNLIVELTNIEDGWILDKSPSEQTYDFHEAYRNGSRIKYSCDFALKPSKGQDSSTFSCILRFHQEDSGSAHTIYLNPAIAPVTYQQPLCTARRIDVLPATKPLRNLFQNGSSDYLRKICECLDTHKKGVGDYRQVCSHYKIDNHTVSSRFENHKDGSSHALLEYLAASDPQLTVAAFTKVVREKAKREDVAQLLEEYDRLEEQA